MGIACSRNAESSESTTCYNAFRPPATEDETWKDDYAFSAGVSRDDVEDLVDSLDVPFYLKALLRLLPISPLRSLSCHVSLNELTEVVMDLGRVPLARFQQKEMTLSNTPVTNEDISEVEGMVGKFGKDNRAGISGTLHRISCVRNREDKIIGITCRVGRDIPSSDGRIQDIIEKQTSILFLGPPGVGKTTVIRCVCKYLSAVQKKRVVIVDTSNEIAGDGDVPHSSVGSARRLQVPTNKKQYEVMLEAIQNHTPEVLVIDEIGTKEECEAAKMVSRRGIKLIASAHGCTLKDVLNDPILQDLLGGIQTVIHGDQAVKYQKVEKTARARKWEPSFDVLIEMKSREEWTIVEDLQAAVDKTLNGSSVAGEVRVETKQKRQTIVGSGHKAVDGEEAVSKIDRDREELPGAVTQQDLLYVNPSEQNPISQDPEIFDGVLQLLEQRTSTSDSTQSQTIQGKTTTRASTELSSVSTHRCDAHSDSGSTIQSTMSSTKTSRSTTAPVEAPQTPCSRSQKTTARKKEVARILSATSPEEVLQAHAAMTNSQLYGKYVQISSILPKAPTNNKPTESPEMQGVMESDSSYNCLKVSPNVTLDELDKVYKKWTEKFDGWRGIPFRNAVQTKLKKSYNDIKEKLT